LIAEDAKSAELIKPFLVGRDIKRYQPLKSERFLIFTRRGVDIENYPAIKSYLLQFKEQLMPKPKDWQGENWPGRAEGSYNWYEIQSTIDYYEEFEKPKIVYAEIAARGQFTLDENSFYSETTTFMISSCSKYLLSILNSKLFTFIFSNVSSEIRGGFYRWKRQYMFPLPVRTIDFNNPTDKTHHDQLVQLVEQILELNQQLALAKDPPTKKMLSRQIQATDQQIDQLIYVLYGLTEEEIALVEAGD
jgi:hypothetical protein